MQKVISSLLLVLGLLYFFSKPVSAQITGDLKYRAIIREVREATCPDTLAQGDCLFFDLEIVSGNRKGEVVNSTLVKQDDSKVDFLNYTTGDRVFLVETQVGGETEFYVKEPIRTNSLLFLALVFIFTVIAIGRIQGLSSLLGLGISFVIIFKVTLPLILNGANPISVSILSSVIIMTVSIFLSHGFNRKTSIALIGTIAALLITGFLARIYTYSAQLTGFASDEATFLVQLIDKDIDMRGILLASLIIGGIGILDDITVSQVSTIQELHGANPNLTAKELFSRSMKVGRDHISSMVNTLVLAYTGSSLQLVLLFIASGASLLEILNTEIVAEEIVRTLIGSIGLMLAVPITSLIASNMIAQKNANKIGTRRRFPNRR